MIAGQRVSGGRFIAGLKMSKKILSFFLSVMMILSFVHAAPRLSRAAEDLRSRAARGASLAKRSRLQTEMPAEIENIEAQDFAPGFRWTPPFMSREFFIRLARILLFCAIAAIFLIILFNLKNNLWSRSREKKLVFGGEKERGADAASRME